MLNFVPFPEPYNPPMDKSSVRIREIDAEISTIRHDMGKLQKRIGELRRVKTAIEKNNS